MKKTIPFFGGLALGALAVLAVAATIVVRQPTPSAFYDYTGTNAIILGGDAPARILSGTNLYTGYTTNYPLNVTNAHLSVVDGVITGIQ